MGYPDYLVHYNRNHDKKSGRFTYGDGDGDGIRDDHSNQKDKESFGDKVKKAAKTYDEVTESSRNRSLRTEKYKVDRGILRKQQAEISSGTTSAKVQEKFDKLALQREKQDTKDYIRLARLEASNQRRQARIERAAQRFEEKLQKNQLRAEKSAQAGMSRNENREYRRARSEARKVSNYQTLSRLHTRNAIIDVFTLHPTRAFFNAMAASTSAELAKNVINRNRGLNY